MLDHFDEDLEKFGKEAGNNFYPNINPPDWSKIEAKLDIELPVKKRKRRFGFLFFLIPICVMSIFLTSVVCEHYTTKKSTLKSNVNKKETNIVVPSLVKQDKVETIVLEQNTVKNRTSEKLLPTELSQVKISNQFVNNRRTIKRSKAKYKATIQLNNSIEENNDVALNVNENNNIQLNEINDFVKPRCEKVNEVVEKLNFERTIEKPMINSYKLSNSIIQERSNSKNEKFETNTPLKVKTGIKRNRIALEIGSTFGIDKSNVKFKYNAPLSTSFGISTNLFLSKHFVLNSGLLFTRKNYKVAGEDYTSKNYVAPSSVTILKIFQVQGNCSMIEIPFNVKYVLRPQSNLSLYISSGLSSYLMKQENYNIQVSYNNRLPVLKEKIYRNNQHYFFGIANATIGLRKRINKKFTLEFETFYKVPFSGIGTGEIQLNSIGINTSFMYRIF